MEQTLIAAAQRLERKMRDAEKVLAHKRAPLEKENAALHELVEKQSEMLNIQATVIDRLEADLRASRL